MSPNTEHVGSFVNDLLVMAKATERLPQIEAELTRMQTQAIADGERIARLERKLLDAKFHEDELNAKLRSVEAERDNAGFRELEATDREDNLKRVIRDCQIAMGEAMKALEPVAAPPSTSTSFTVSGEQGVGRQILMPSESLDQREVVPTTATSVTVEPVVASTVSGTVDGNIPVEQSPLVEPFAPYLGEQPTPGQSEPLPTASTETQSIAGSRPQEDGELNPRPTTEQGQSAGSGLAVAASPASESSSANATDEAKPRPFDAGIQKDVSFQATAETTNTASAIPTEAQEVPQLGPTPIANGQLASAKPPAESASAPPSDDWWPQVSRASNYSG